MKRKLLLAALCVVSALGFKAHAQSWAGNAPAAGKFFLYNVGAKKFLNNGDPKEQWGTNAYLQAGFGMDVTLEETNGAYNFNTNVSNGGSNNYLGTSTWCDGGATPWTFEAVDGQTNTYTIKNGVSYLVANDALDDVVYGASTNDSKSWWKLVSLNDFKTAMQAKAYSATDPMDVSVFIQGRSFARNDGRNNSWTTTHNGGNWDWIGVYDNKYYGNESWNNTFSVSQTITDLPEGTYEVRCSGFGTNGTTYIFGNTTSKAIQTDNTTSYGNNKQAKWKAIHEDDAFAGQSTGTFAVGDGTLNLGIKRETNKSGDWAIWDEFRLYYYGLDLSEFASTLATAVEAAQAIEEGTIPTAAYNALGAIVTQYNKTYTSVADYTNAISKINEAVATYASSAMVADYTRYKTVKAAIKSINVSVDLTAADAQAEAATTTDALDAAVSTARAALVTYLPTASLGAGETIDLTDALIDNAAPGVSGKTDYWTNSETPGLQYQLYEYYQKSGATTKQIIANLPAGNYRLTAVAFTRTGYEAKLSAGTASVNIATVASNVVNDRNGGNNWIAQGNGNGVTDLTFNLAQQTSDLEIGLTAYNATDKDNWMCWRSFRLVYGDVFEPYTLVTGKMNAQVSAAQTAADEAFQANKNPENYNAVKSAIANAQASKAAYATAATAIANANELKEAHNLASATAYTTFAEAIAALETKYDANTMTTDEGNGAGLALGSVVTGWHAGANSAAVAYLNNGFGLNAFDQALYINTWSNEGEGDGSNFKVPFYEYFAGEGSALSKNTWTGQVSGLENGLYSVSAWVRVRSMNGETAAADLTGISMNVNGGTSVDVTEGDIVPVQEGNARFQHKVYTAEGLVKDGVLNLNFDIAEDNNIHWLSFKNIKYTKVRDLTPEEEIVYATAEDYEALAQAIEVAEAKTFGFEEGEYAPYNNIAAIAALNGAKAIDPAEQNVQASVQEATAALTGATWTANTTEVNAVYNGDFSLTDNNAAPAGWRSTKNGAFSGQYMPRVFNGDDRLAEFNETKSAFFIRFDGTNSDRGTLYYYGDADDTHIMPLKAETYYYVKADIKGWGSSGKKQRLNVTGPTGFSSVYQEITLSDKADTDDATPQQFLIVFKTTVAGNYSIFLQTPGDDNQKHNAVISNIELYKAASASLAVNSDVKYGTFAAPFDVAVPEGVTAYKVEDVESDAELKLEEVTTIEANKPVLLYAENGYNATTVYGKAVAAENVKNGLLTGVYAETDAPVGSYVLQYLNDKAAFYKVADGAQLPKVGANRAYLTLPSNAAAPRAIFIDGEATGISAYDVLTSGQYDGIYTANGVQIPRLQKGVNILKKGNKTYKIYVK